MSTMTAHPPAAQPVPLPAAGLSPAALGRVRRFTVDEYHALIRSGFVKAGDRTVLLEGVLVQQMGINRRT